MRMIGMLKLTRMRGMEILRMLMFCLEDQMKTMMMMMRKRRWR